MSLIRVAIDRLLKTDPAAWLGHKLTETLDPIPETVGEAMDMVKAKAKMAIDSATEQLQAKLATLQKENTEWQEQIAHHCIEIAELNEQLTAEKEKNRWIPVGERLPVKPKETEQIECVDKHKRVWARSLFPNLFDKVDLVKDGVTHWRPITLPEGATE